MSTPSHEPDDPREESGLHLHWQGRRSYRSLVPTPRVLQPNKRLSFGNDDRNLIIEGDNLQVMVSLRSQFTDAVDVVYIDPPYNRGGNDFRYSDARFNDPNADASDAVYVANEDGGKHTKWLNYMAPRLVAIHKLMADHGVIFVSINDIELGRLLLLMDDIFDERNRLGMITWRGSSDNNPSRIAIEHEYIVVYAKSEPSVANVWTTPSDDIRDTMLERFDEIKKSTSNVADLTKAWRRFVLDNKESLGRLKEYTRVDDRGPYQSARRVHNPKPGGYKYGVWEKGIVADEHDARSYTLPANGYRFRPETMQKLVEAGEVIFPASRSNIVQMKDYLEDYRGTLRSVIDLDARGGSYRLKTLFGKNFDGFRNAKPVELIEELVGAAGSKDSLILDAFAGSGTTGEAVLRLNKLDDGSRRFIMIEEGEGTDRYARTLVAPRIKKAIQKDGLPGGFSFMVTGKELDRDAILGLERDKIAAVICQTDRSGSGSGIRRIEGKRWVIGANQRLEAIALVWNGTTKSRVTPEIINQTLKESSSLGLKAPIRIYGTTCSRSDTKQFRFCQIPDEILMSLTFDDNEDGLVTVDGLEIDA